jgi:hypothetical protein
MTESMTDGCIDDGGRRTDFPHPNLNLSTRTWHLMTEIRDLKMGVRINLSGFRSPFEFGHLSNR